MSDQLLSDFPQITDSNGDPISGGNVTFVKTGTPSEKLSIFSDQAATTAMANPVELDAEGRHPQVFYIGSDAAKAIIRNANGAVVRTIDPCPRVSITASAASSISATPTVNNPGVTVQEQIDNNSSAIVNLTTQSYATLGAGTANDVVLTTGRNLSVVPDGFTLRYRATATNTGPMTFAIDGLTAVAGKTITNRTIPAGYIRTAADTVLTFDGSDWIVDRVIARNSGAGGTVVQLADTLAVLRHTMTLTFSSAAALTGTWVYPASFDAAPVVHVTLQTLSATSTTTQDLSVFRTGVPGVSQSTITLNRQTGGPDFVSGDTAIVSLTAFGTLI